MEWSYSIHTKSASNSAPWLGVFNLGHRAIETRPPLVGHLTCCHGGRRVASWVPSWVLGGGVLINFFVGFWRE